MEMAIVVDAKTGKALGPQVQFVRVPVPGEFLSAPPNLLKVTHVVHAWMAGGAPFATVHVEPAQSHPAAAPEASHTNPF